VTINWDRNFKNRLLCSKDTQTGARVTANTCRVRWRGNPYLVCEFVSPPYALTRPVSVPAWRTVAYQSIDTTAAAALSKATFTVQNLRFDSFPSCLCLLVERTVKDGAADGEALRTSFHYLDYFCEMSDLDITINEKAKVLSEKTDYEMYRMFRRNTKSRITFRQWRRVRCQYVIRSDDLAITSENVYEPMSISIGVQAKKSINDDQAAAGQYTLRILALYASEALSLSQQSATVSSLLLSKSDYRDLAVVGKAKAAEAAQGPSISDYS
jgi:hypothetical protein